MKHIALFGILILFVVLLPKSSKAQYKLDISVKSSGFHCDSLKLQSYNWEKKSGTNMVVPFGAEVSFKSKTPLSAGVYWLTADTLHKGVILIPSEKQQKLKLTLTEKGIVFENSPENNLYQEYVRIVQQFEQQLAGLDREFQEARNLPQYMLRSIADSLSARAVRINRARRDYEEKLLTENKGSLLASIVQVNMQMPDIPPAYYNNVQLAQAFVLEHYFDHFPWNDPRIFNSPMAEDKLSYYCRQLVYEWDRPELDTFVVKALEQALVNKESHLLFFDRLEQDLGYYMSNYKVEHSYIRMLLHILRTRPDVEKVRRTYYENELKTINKNTDGTRAANFQFVTSTGDTTSLYDFQSEYTLLVLHNPTCSTCRAVRKRMSRYASLNNAIASGRLKVLTVYLENDSKLWQHYIETEAEPNYQHGWNFDQAIENDNLYETRTIPYMYLLNKDKQVIRKNILVNEIEDYLRFLGLAN